MTWYAVGIAAVGAVTSIAGGISGKKAAEEAGKKQAKIIRQTGAENQRRMELNLDEQVGGIRAAIGASNLQLSGSSAKYKNVFESNLRSEMAWDKQKTRLEARMAEKTGQLAGSSAMYAGASSAVGFASIAAGRFSATPKTGG
jgi:hypothetical protein